MHIMTTTEYVLYLQAIKHSWEIIAKSTAIIIAILFIFSIANDIAILFPQSIGTVIAIPFCLVQLTILSITIT